jgi:YNFM family putative membrane transporter
LAAYLSRILPRENLNVAMGSYVSATVAGGMSSRLLGGLFHPDLNWRYAFLTASVLVAVATVAACRLLPQDSRNVSNEFESEGFLHLISRSDLLGIYLVAFSAFFVFSSIFNYIPFYLEGPPFNASTGLITTMYLSYLIGIIMGPLAGRLSNRIGNGGTMALGSSVFAVAIGITLLKSLPAIAISLALSCAGFFAIHAAAAGSLNSRLNSGRGRANSLYVLFYYLGGFAGISMSGYTFASFGWPGLTALELIVLLVPFSIGVWNMAKTRGS